MSKLQDDTDVYWDLFCYNGNIRTLDKKTPTATWMLIHNGRIAKVGTDPFSNIQAKQRLNLHGKTVIPGFIDSHTHLFSYGIAQKFYLNLGDVKSSQEAAEKIRLRSLELHEDEWLVATDWDESEWNPSTPLNREILDNACPKNPVYAFRVCGHLVAINSIALQLLADQLDNLPEKKKVESSQGLLRNVEIEKKLYLPPSSKIIEGIHVGCLEAARLGITTAHDMVAEYLLPYYFKTEKMGILKTRICVNIPATVLVSIKGIGITSSFGSDKLRISGVKLFWDGSLGARSALLSKDYVDSPGERGKRINPYDELTTYLDQAMEAQVQPVVHAIGDQAIDDVLKEFKKRREKITTLRPRIEHAEMISDSHIDVASDLNVILSMQPNFCKWALPSGLYEQRLGKVRTRQMNAFAKVIEKDVTLAFGSDGMPLGPLFGIHLAVNHPVKEFSLEVEEAIRSYTIAGAFCEFQEHEKGTLSEGKLADFVVLSEDPWTNSQRINEIQVEMTMVGGEIVFRDVNTTIEVGN